MVNAENSTVVKGTKGINRFSDFTALLGREGAGGYFAITVTQERFIEIWGMTIEEFARLQTEQPVDPIRRGSHPGRAY